MKLLALAMALMLLLGCLPAMAEAAAEIPADYQRVAENSAFCLYLQEDTMALIAQCKENGQLLYSTVQNPNTGNKTWKGFYQSGIVIEYLEDVKDKPIQADFINNANTIAASATENTSAGTDSSVGVANPPVTVIANEGREAVIAGSALRTCGRNFGVLASDKPVSIITDERIEADALPVVG
jgi:hypothetical protein